MCCINIPGREQGAKVIIPGRTNRITIIERVIKELIGPSVRDFVSKDVNGFHSKEIIVQLGIVFGCLRILTVICRNVQDKLSRNGIFILVIGRVILCLRFTLAGGE